jgi:hypothetical protein
MGEAPGGLQLMIIPFFQVGHCVPVKKFGF